MKSLTVHQQAALREDYLARRTAQRALVEDLAETLPKPALHECAQELGLWDRGGVALERDEQLGILVDFAIYEYRIRCGTNAVERLWAQQGANLSPIEREVISAMLAVRFTILRLEEVVPNLGAWVEDLLYEEQYLVCDIALAAPGNSGIGLGARVLQFPEFVMTTGAPFGVPPDIVDVLRRDLARQQPGEMAKEMRSCTTPTLRKLAAQITRAAVGNRDSRQMERGTTVIQPVLLGASITPVATRKDQS